MLNNFLVVIYADIGKKSSEITLKIAQIIAKTFNKFG
jgi:hypothetical protein